jgi:hypothetical protein
MVKSERVWRRSALLGQGDLEQLISENVVGYL